MTQAHFNSSHSTSSHIYFIYTWIVFGSLALLIMSMSSIFSYSVDDVKPKKRKEYKQSELRLIESLENICDRVLEYNLHKERKGSTRFAKGMSQTFKTLHGLVNKGVKVDLGMPYELWDSPPAEVSRLKSQCETLIEQHEDDVEDWYYNVQDKGIPLIKYLCEDNILRNEDSSCLYESIDAEDKDEEYQKGSKEEL